MSKAAKINLFDFKTVPMRAFHTTWFAFFLSFFGWFAIAPLMPVIRQDLGLTKEQIGNTIIASVAITILVRLVMGWLCDRIGPRKAYAMLLVVGSLPIMGIGLAHDYNSFLLFRLAIGAIGASFVITQYHTSVMFAPNCVGTANATAAGWGNMGGGVTQMVMPLILGLLISLGIDKTMGWRLSMVVPGALLFIMGIIYYKATKDFPEGNVDELREKGLLPQKAKAKGSFREALKDPRVWALCVIYGASFGVELTINNIAALYFTDQFNLGLAQAGMVAGIFGLMNIFARTLGGYFSDVAAKYAGLKGRVIFLGSSLFIGGLLLMVFSKMTVLPLAITMMVSFALFVKMANGATYSVVPFINKRALGAVAGIIGAGGNVGGVLFGFLFRDQAMSYATGLFYLGALVAGCAALAFFVRFSPEVERETKIAFDAAQMKKLEIQPV
jgi:MFS transporter, NNP family, nitrate/nitrite transporter